MPKITLDFDLPHCYEEPITVLQLAKNMKQQQDLLGAVVNNVLAQPSSLLIVDSHVTLIHKQGMPYVSTRTSSN
jgi:hypothetical protein